jgi:nucleotide-binding universal stress UspA family protein
LACELRKAALGRVRWSEAGVGGKAIKRRTMYTRMLIPLDGSKTAEKVLPYARLLAKTLKIPVDLLGVIDIAGMAAHLVAEKARYLEVFIEQAEKSSQAYLKRIAPSFCRAPVRCMVERGRPEEVIIEKAAADGATLITMATHGRSGINRWLLGSVTEKVLRGTSNPLFLVRANEGATIDGEAALKTVIVPLDGSELAESVLPKVVELAKSLDLEVMLVRAYELPSAAYYGSEDYLPNYEELKNQVRAQASDYLDGKIGALTAEGVEKISRILVEGPGPHEIISCAQKTPGSLVAMCTHGRSGVKRWILGSVTEKVVRHSGDPVLVVRGTAATRIDPARKLDSVGSQEDNYQQRFIL